MSGWDVATALGVVALFVAALAWMLGAAIDATNDDNDNPTRRRGR